MRHLSVTMLNRSFNVYWLPARENKKWDIYGGIENTSTGKCGSDYELPKKLETVITRSGT